MYFICIASIQILFYRLSSSLKFLEFSRYIQHRVYKNNSDKDFIILMIEATVLLHNIFYVSTSYDKIPNGIWKRWKCIYSRYLPDDIIYVILTSISIHKWNLNHDIQSDKTIMINKRLFKLRTLWLNVYFLNDSKSSLYFKPWIKIFCIFNTYKRNSK